MMILISGPQHRRHCWLIPAVCAAVVSLTVPARAALIVTVGSTSVRPGTSGDTFDVSLMNTGTSAVTIGGFEFEIMVPTSAIVFTAVNTGTTSPYIFGSNGFSGSDISSQPPNLPGQLLSAADIFATPNAGISLGAGSTVGLGHVLFNVLSTAAPGPITVTLVGSGTVLSDPTGTGIALGTPNNGTITVQGATVPAPSSLLMGLIATASVIAVRRIWK